MMSVQAEVDSEEAQNTSEDIQTTQETTDDERTTRTKISKDDAFHVLQNARRRAVLRYLAEHNDKDRFVMRDIAEEVAAWEHDTTVQQLVSDERQRVYIALYQSHLPKLDKHDIIDYNQSRGVVERTELTAAFEPYVGDELGAEDELTVDDASSNDTESERSGLTSVLSTVLGR